MPVHVIAKGTGPGIQVPAHLKRILVSAISSSTSCFDLSVKGKVIQKGPLVSLEDGNAILKTVIEDGASQPNTSSCSQSINVVLRGALAEDFSRAVSQGDEVVVSGFTVGKSPTVLKDKLHSWNLLLSGDDACVYVSHLQAPASSKRSVALTAEVSRMAKAPKYTYVGLGNLKPGTVVNVYGVVIFFKPPFKSRGTDFCSSLKIIDQSNQKVCCTIFRKKLEDHPKIFQIGDIVRLHRVKTSLFGDSVTLVNTFGFSVVTLDGMVGGAMEPRTSSATFHFDQEDRGIVEELRSWSCSQAVVPVLPSVPLSAVQPKAYFDLTCQLLSTTRIDNTCTLLRVWDGTRCPHTLLKVTTEPQHVDTSSSSKERRNLIASVLAYDNHVVFAQQLQPGAFVRIYNLRAIPGSSKVPGLGESQPEVDHLAFHLHGGTAYGRGIRVLPENSPDVEKLKMVLEAVSEDEDSDSELSDSSMLVWSTPPEYLDPHLVDCHTERCCRHAVPAVTLDELKKAKAGGTHHLKVQLRSYEPRRLHQALKLYCSKCTSLQNVPDEDLIADLFSEACRDLGPYSMPPWAVCGQVACPGSPSRALSLHFSSQLISEGRTKELFFLMGSTLEETCQLASGYQNIVPVRALGGRLVPLDLTAPFLFRGRRRYYGCRRCSEADLKEPSVDGVEVIDEKIVAEALCVQLLQFVLVMKLQLQDATDTLDVFLWRDAELFFGVSAEDVAGNQEAQDSVRQTVNALCPAGGSAAERPWLDVCLTAYQVEDGGQYQTCYQICQTRVTSTPCT
ncbi:protection of telomeres protein 1 [Thalassophryne amazonica]|uniref:protection of telomeres protein 1 n=1 Tax=Thalassophryne amazonica TaxID=390379 RepID=UPI001471EE59|nr:protection of telomeres protein 1 [Thalassophryne amazonica]